MELQRQKPLNYQVKKRLVLGPKLWPFALSLLLSALLLLVVAWSLPESEHKILVFVGLLLTLVFSSYYKWKKSLRIEVSQGILRIFSPSALATPLTNISQITIDPLSNLKVSLYNPDLVFPPTKTLSLLQDMDDYGFHFEILGINQNIAVDFCKVCNLLPDLLTEQLSDLENTTEIDSFQYFLKRRTPRIPVTYTLLGINLLVYLWMLCSGVGLLQPTSEQLIAWGANLGPLTLNGESWRLIFSAFLHIGLIHLAINMIVLWQIGPFVERLLTSSSFCIIYFLCAIAGSEASLWWNDFGVSAGASGALFGIFGTLLGYLMGNPIGLSVEIIIKLRQWALQFIVLNFALMFFLAGIDQAAHAGGAVAGFLLGYLLCLMVKNKYFRLPLLKNLSLVVVGAVLLYSSWLFLKHDCKDKFLAIKTFERFSKEEEPLLRKFSETYEQVKRNQISEKEFLEVLETEIYPAWSSYALIFSDIKRVPKKWSAWYADFVLYLTTQKEAQELLQQAIKNKDEGKAREAEKKFNQANDLVKKISETMKSNSKKPD